MEETSPRSAGEVPPAQPTQGAPASEAARRCRRGTGKDGGACFTSPQPTMSQSQRTEKVGMSIPKRGRCQTPGKSDAGGG